MSEASLCSTYCLNLGHFYTGYQFRPSEVQDDIWVCNSQDVPMSRSALVPVNVAYLLLTRVKHLQVY